MSTLDSTFKQLLEPLERKIDALSKQVADLKQSTLADRHELARPIYDAKQLQDELGFSKRGAYEVLKAMGFKRGGRLRITAEALQGYMSPIPPEGARAGSTRLSEVN